MAIQRAAILIIQLCAVLIGGLLVCVAPCMIFAVGKKATVDGSTLIAHTDDAGGGSADLRLVRVPAMDHPPGNMRPVYEFFGGYPRVVTNDRGDYYKPVTGQNLTKVLGYIPQVPHTYAYFDQDYGMQNEKQLSIAESTCSAKTVGWSKSNATYGYNLFGIAELSKVALERCDSARCAIQLMGDLAVKYGFYSEDSGSPAAPDLQDSAEALGIGDRYGEVWIFHVMTGPSNASAVWVAQRVPDGHITAVANSFSIREIDLNDPDNFMASDNVMQFAEDMGWWDPDDGPFDFTAAYVPDDAPSCVGALYTGRRLWRIFDVFAPSLELDSRLGFIPSKPTYPFSVKPDDLIEVPELMAIMRDYYNDTEYDMTKGLAAGPFGTPVRYGGPTYNITGGWERAISVSRAAFSFVLQSREYLPDDIGGVVWYGQDAPHGTCYIPFYCSQEAIPKSYVKGLQSVFNLESAWWAFNFVNNWSQLRFNEISKDIVAKYTAYEKEAFLLLEKLEKEAQEKFKDNSPERQRFLQANTNAFAEKVISGWWQFAWQLVGKYSGGCITTGELPQEQQAPGYPKEWLLLSEFAGWPGDTFTPPKGAVYTGVNLGGLPHIHSSLIYVISGAVGLIAIGGFAWRHSNKKRKGYISI